MAYTLAEDLTSGPPVDKAKPEKDAARHARKRRGVYRVWGKRLMDVAVVLVLAPIVLPLLFVVALVTALDGGSAFYAQTRIGRDGRVFKCWKIRTMVPNAEAVLQRMIRNDGEIAREWEENQKLARDPRVTRWGRALRRTSLDELPQLWNVLKGDMSLIGPRPFTPEQKTLYDANGQSAAYYQLRPGITGLWQVDRRNEGAFGDRVDYDRRYNQDLSLFLDLTIAFRTVLVMAKATGK